MKFYKSVWRLGPRERSPRRVAAAKRRVKRDMDKMALFPELVEHKTAEERLTSVEIDHDQYVLRMRAHAARNWRKARYELQHGLPPLVAEGIKRWWQSDDNGVPRDPAYLLSAIHDVKVRGASYWRAMRINKQLSMIFEGKLPKSVAESIKAWD